MRGKTILCFLILSGSLLQAFASLPEKESNASSNLHDRIKRIVDNTHQKDEKVLHQEVRYVVLLINHAWKLHCTGIILAPHVVLSAAHCAFGTNISAVISGIHKTPSEKLHNVVNVIVHDHYYTKVQIENDLCLIVVREPIDIRPNIAFNRAISIYNGVVPPNSKALVSGWGRTSIENHEYPTSVRSIWVPIINHNECHDMISKDLNFSKKHICTHYPNREKCCWFGDSGGPLVYDGHLIGVVSVVHDNPHMADIFMNLMYPEYKYWVESWVRRIDDHALHLQ